VILVGSNRAMNYFLSRISVYFIVGKSLRIHKSSTGIRIGECRMRNVVEAGKATLDSRFAEYFEACSQN